MTLVDSSVWIDHVRPGGHLPRLAELIRTDQLLIHPAVLGEVALGNLGPRRAVVLQALGRMSQAPVVDEDAALAFVELQSLAGSGIGWVDVHLLASARLAHAKLWTLDKRLARVAARLGVAA